MKRNHAPDVERTLYRPVEVAQRWGVDRTTVYRMADDGRLKTVSTPFGLRIHQDEHSAYRKRRRRRQHEAGPT